MLNHPPLALYIHIPWCERKCPYCDFNSHQVRGAIDEAEYVTALLADLAKDLVDFDLLDSGREISTIFIGGGTPSLFSASSMKKLISGVKARVACAADVEITCEANPSSSEAVKFAGFREAGINRLSIGVQSFNQQHLRALGRVHSANEALAAAAYAQQAGFDNFNLDLMFGLPEQTLEQASEDLAQAIALSPQHLSCYQLTIEPNTLFHHQPPITPDHDSLWEMQAALQSKLAQAQFDQYEVSAYARAGQRCRHNLNYWQFGDYLGIGAGAHAKLTQSNGQVTRRFKVKHPARYLQSGQSFVGGESEVAAQQLPFEFMLNALRLTQGFSLELFESRCALSRDTIAEQLEKHQQQGLITIEQDYVLSTPRGRQMLDTMLQDYLED